MQNFVDTADTISSASRNRRPINIAHVVREGKRARRPRPHQSDLAPRASALPEVMLLSTDSIVEAEKATVACSVAVPFVLGSELVSRSPTCEVSIACGSRDEQLPHEEQTPTRCKRQARRSSRATVAPSAGRAKRRSAPHRAGDVRNTQLHTNEHESLHVNFTTGDEDHNDVVQSSKIERSQYGNHEGSADLHARSESCHLTHLAAEENVTSMSSPISDPLETFAVSSLSRSSRDSGLGLSSSASLLRLCPAAHISLASHSDSIGLASLDHTDLRRFLVRVLEQLSEQQRIMEERGLEVHALQWAVEESSRNGHDVWQKSTIPPASELARDALPNVVVTKEDLMDDTTARCPICFESYCPGTRATRMLCGHLFCTGCIWEWLNTANSCPVCRYELPTNDSDFEVARLERMRWRRACLKEGDLSLMSVHRLKQLMLILSVSSEACSEKAGLISRLRADTKIEIRSDRIDLYYDEAELRPLDLCALRSLMKRHNVVPPSVELGDKEARIECLTRLQAAGFINTSGLRTIVDDYSEPRERTGNDRGGSVKVRSKRPKTGANGQNLPCRKSSRVCIGKPRASRSAIVGHPLTNGGDTCLEFSHSGGPRFAELVLQSNPKDSGEGIGPCKFSQPKHVSAGLCTHREEDLPSIAQSTADRKPDPLEPLSADSETESPSRVPTGCVACGSPVSIGDIAPSPCTQLCEDAETVDSRAPQRSTEAYRGASLIRCLRSFLSCMLKPNRRTSG